MGHRKNTQRTFVLKLNLHCPQCPKRVEKLVGRIEGVYSVRVDEDLALGKVTISGSVDPQTVINKLYIKMKKRAELLGKEEESPPQTNHSEYQTGLQQNPVPHEKKEEESPPEINNQENQLVLQHNPVQNTKFLDRRRVAPQPAGIISEPADKQMKIEIHSCCSEDDHEFELKSYNKPFKCDGCKEDGFTWGYRCKLCTYELHKDCKDAKPTITLDLCRGSIFNLRKKPGHNCDACGMEIHGHSYRCEAHNLDLHPACSKLPGNYPIGGTDFVLCKKIKYECFWCKHMSLAGAKTAGWCYVSEPNKFSCHVHCITQILLEAWKRGQLDCKDDITSKALENVDLKHVANAKGGSGTGGGGASLFLNAVTIFLKTLISILFGDPTGLIVSVLTEVVKSAL